MAFQLKSNPLDNNPLFSTQPQPQPEPQPAVAAEQNEQPEQPAKPRKSAKKSAKKPSGSRGGKTTNPAASAKPAPQQTQEINPDAEAYIRATFIVRRDLLRLLKDYAYTERREIKEVINEILAEALAKIESDYAADGRKLIERE